jgi:hypothetical protein
MPRGSKILGKPIDEDKWAEAKKRASEEGQEGNYAVVMDIYKKMSHSGEFAREHVAERRKKHQTLPAWKERRWDSKKRELKATKKSMDDHIRLILAKGDLDEFHCGSCGVLLFKGVHLEKAMIEVKCRSCKSMLVSPAMAVLELS